LKALTLEISFFEAFFKVHYTKGFRLSYPIPLPTAVAGMFGAILGVPRGRVLDRFREMKFGALLLSRKGQITENVTFMQVKAARADKGVASTFILNEPSYLISMAGEDRLIERLQSTLTDGIAYLPYGGQNDYFLRDLRVIGIDEVGNGSTIANYAPSDWVEAIESKEAELEILPVMHKLSDSPNFFFLTRGTMRLKSNVACVSKHLLGLYQLEGFFSTH